MFCLTIQENNRLNRMITLMISGKKEEFDMFTRQMRISMKLSLAITIGIFFGIVQDAHAEICWTSIGPGGGGVFTTIAIAPSNSNIVYVGTDVGGIYKSKNGANSWKIKNNGFTNYYVETITVHPTKPETVYAGTHGGVFRSTNGGDNWVSMRNGFPPISGSSFSAPIGAIAIETI